MDWEAIRKEYESTDITMKDLADKHGVKSSTLRSRKNREKWQRNNVKNVATKKATQRKSVATRSSVKKLLEDNEEMKPWEIEFCYEYLKEFNATKSYLSVKDVKYRTAITEGNRLLTKPYIKAFIRDVKEQLNNESFIELSDIRKEYEKQAFSNVSDYVEFGIEEVELVDDYDQPIYDSAGNPKTVKRSFLQFKNKEDIDGTLIKEIRMGKDGPVVQLYDKQKAMQELLKLMDHGGNTNGGVIFLDSKEEMEKYLRERGETDGD